jgi:hypothetical protein
MHKDFEGTLMSVTGALKGKVAMLMLVLILPVALGGCYGNFPLTKTIYKYNGEVSDSKWVKTLVFWVFCILPVYGLGAFVDAIFFNLVEFWSGKQLMTAIGPTTDSNGNTVTLAPSADGKEAILTVSRDGQTLTQERFVRVSDSLIEVRGMDGQLHGKVTRSADGGFNLCDQSGNVVQTISGSQLVAMK